MSLDTTKDLLAVMVERKANIVANLEPDDQQALFEAFSQLSLYAATVSNEKELLALSNVIYSIVADLPELEDELPPEMLSHGRTRGVSKRAIKKATQKSQKSQHVRQYGKDIANQMHFFVGESPSVPTLSEIGDDRSSWLEAILDRFFAR